MKDYKSEDRFVPPYPPPMYQGAEIGGFQEHVLTPLLQNLWAGIGLGLLVKFFPQLWEIELSDQTSLIWAITLFSILCVFRFSRDDISLLIIRLSERLYQVKLERDNSGQVVYYEGRIEQLEAYIRDLKSQLETFGGVMISNPLTGDEIAERKILAIRLYNRLMSGMPITRDECLRVKVFETRLQWETARKFLVDAGIIESSGKLLAAAIDNGIVLIEAYADNLRNTRLKK